MRPVSSSPGASLSLSTAPSFLLPSPYSLVPICREDERQLDQLADSLS